MISFVALDKKMKMAIGDSKKMRKNKNRNRSKEQHEVKNSNQNGNFPWILSLHFSFMWCLLMLLIDFHAICKFGRSNMCKWVHSSFHEHHKFVQKSLFDVLKSEVKNGTKYIEWFESPWKKDNWRQRYMGILGTWDFSSEDSNTFNNIN